MSTFNSSGVPIGGTTELLDQNLVDRLKIALPEQQSIFITNPSLISSNAMRNIIIKTDKPNFSGAEIWVTFISEVAGYRNVLGYFIYELQNET